MSGPSSASASAKGSQPPRSRVTCTWAASLHSRRSRSPTSAPVLLLENRKRSWPASSRSAVRRSTSTYGLTDRSPGLTTDPDLLGHPMQHVDQLHVFGGIRRGLHQLGQEAAVRPGSQGRTGFQYEGGQRRSVSRRGCSIRRSYLIVALFKAAP